MFCPQCGSNIPDAAVRCKHCGADTAPFSKESAPPPMVFCRSCGSQISRDADVCVHCGKATRESRPVTGPHGEERSWLVSVVLCAALFLTGFGGMHRFYTGHIGTGLLQLFTVGGCGIWQFIDLLLILTGAFRDAEGRPLYQ